MNITEETIKSLWRDLSPNGKYYLPLERRDLQFKSHNIEFAKHFNNEDQKIDKLIQGILTRVITKEPGKYVSAIAVKNISENDILKYQNGEKISIDFEEISCDFPYQIMDQILTIDINSPSTRDEKFKLAKSLILPYLKIKPGLPSIEDINESELAFDLYQKNNFTKDSFIGFSSILNKEIKICQKNQWAYYSPSLKLKYGIYYTPEKFKEQSEKLIKKYSRETDIIWEPFAGDGRLVKNFKNKEISDILPVVGTIKNDYIKSNWEPKYDLIYTNPGFSIATQAFEKMLNSGKKFGIYIPDYALPKKSLPIIDGFYTFSSEWPNLPINNSSKDGFGIVFVIVDPKQKPKDTIILRDQDNKEILLELSIPDNYDIYDFGNKDYRRFHPQEYALRFNHLFKGKQVWGEIGKFVRKSWIKDISYIDGNNHWWTPPDGKSVQKIINTQKEYDELISNGWKIGRKQKMSNLRKSLKN